MRKSPELFCQFLDVLAAQLSYSKTARLLGIGERSVYRWITDSKSAKELRLENEYYFAWRGGEKNYLHVFLKQCVAASVEEIESACRVRARDGIFSVARYKGQTVFQRDPELIGRPDLIELLGLPDDLLRDATGLPVPEMIWAPPSTDLVQMVLQAHTSKYRRQSTSNVTLDINSRHSGGVLVAGNVGVSALPPPPRPPMLEVIEHDAEPLALAVSVEPVAEPFEVAEQSDEPQAMVSAPPPLPEYRNVTPLQRDLLARARAPRDEAGAKVRSAPVIPYTSDPDDFNEARTGSGTIPHDAIKVI